MNTKPLEFTCSCGHTITRVINFNSASDRERKINYLTERISEELCDDCREEQIRTVAQKVLDELNAPKLTGTPKQIKWADTLRGGYVLAVKDENPDVMKYVISVCGSAKDWIDNRDRMCEYADEIFKEFKKEEEKSLKISKTEREAEEEITVSPKEVLYPGTVVIRYNQNQKCIESKYMKSPRFMEIVENDGYRFDWMKDIWIRVLHEANGNPVDRMAELGNKLLAQGFKVMISDDEAREKAISGEYEPECRRWIFKEDESDDTVRVYYDGYNDELYKAAMSIPGAKYRYGSVKIPASQYEAIEDFARVEGFKISTRAQKIMDRFKKSITVEVKEKTPEDDKKSLRDILLESGAIDDLYDSEEDD